MDFLTALNVSASGLAAERTRVNITSSNLANAESTRGPDGKPYHRKDPVFEATSFEGQLEGVRVAEIREDQGPGKKVYSPGHPDADEVVGLVAESRGEPALAAEFLERRAEAGDAPVRVYRRGAQVLVKLGRGEAARRLWALGEKARPDSRLWQSPHRDALR